jgi:tetratricopeptide (TPR) repeat protein
MTRFALAFVLLAGSTLAQENPTEATALTGEPLRQPALGAELRERREADLRQAELDLRERPQDPLAVIWVGRRTAYLGRYRDAVKIYGDGLKQFPGHAKLLRHRGHRWISLRKLDLAIADLAAAAKAIRGQPDEVEPDGLPNAKNIPLSTLNSNVAYHLGLAHYLKGEFDLAERSYREGLKFSKNDDMLCATSHWLYMALRRQGLAAEAEKLLLPIHDEMEIIENTAYHELLMLYKGQRDVDELERRAFAADDGVELATLGYGLANWHFYNGRTQQAFEGWRRVTAGAQWAAFGHIAAEADLLELPRFLDDDLRGMTHVD